MKAAAPTPIPLSAARVLGPEPVRSLADHVGRGGGRAITGARDSSPATIIDVIRDAGLRGRGGAGFPTATKWQTVHDNRAPDGVSTAVVVNAAEGEPGSYKDRFLLLHNPYRVIEGALVAAHAVQADEVVIVLKVGETRCRARVDAAVAEVHAAGWCDGLTVRTVTGAPRYLLGEETALLEAVAGRPPMPRSVPPYREGLNTTEHAADTELAGPSSESLGAPALVNNVETLAHAALITARGAAWFREHGTDDSPGTFLCTLSGSLATHGVFEIPFGTRLDDLLDAAGGPRPGHAFTAMLSGASHGLLPADRFDVPLTHDDMAAAGCGIGSGSYILIDDGDDLVATVAGVSRYLAVESCGQCHPCKHDGLELAEILDRLATHRLRPDDLMTLERRLETVTAGARCGLASQQHAVVDSLLTRFAEAVIAKASERTRSCPPTLVAPIVDLVGDEFVIDDSQDKVDPDWATAVEIDSGKDR